MAEVDQDLTPVSNKKIKGDGKERKARSKRWKTTKFIETKEEAFLAHVNHVISKTCAS